MSAQKERELDPLIGCRVKTLQSTTDDWSYEAKQARKWNTNGVVVDLSNSHGLCYKIRHDDGSDGWYDRSEFLILSE